jgi:hypothetical protein
MRCRLLPGHGCPVSSSCGKEGGGANPDAALPPRGEDVVEFAAAGRADDHRCCLLQGEEYHVVAAIAGHELETPEAEHRPGLKRSLRTTHLELNGKMFVNTQHAPTWRANCRRFGPGGPSTEPTSEFITVCPYLDGLRKMEHKGECGLYYLAPGVLVVGVTSVARTRERACSFARPRATPPPAGRPWTSLL